MSERDGGVGRRVFLSGVGVAAGAVATASAHTAFATNVLDLRATEEGATLRGLAAGTVVDRWTIVAVHPVRMGAIPVVLSTADGDRFQVDVLARDPDASRPLGVGNTPTLSLFLSNRGDGRKVTLEEHGLGAMALAAELARREAPDAVARELLTLRERNAQFPAGAYAVVLG